MCRRRRRHHRLQSRRGSRQQPRLLELSPTRPSSSVTPTPATTSYVRSVEAGLYIGKNKNYFRLQLIVEVELRLERRSERTTRERESETSLTVSVLASEVSTNQAVVPSRTLKHTRSHTRLSGRRSRCDLLQADRLMLSHSDSQLKLLTMPP